MGTFPLNKGGWTFPKLVELGRFEDFLIAMGCKGLMTGLDLKLGVHNFFKFFLCEFFLFFNGIRR